MDADGWCSLCDAAKLLGWNLGGIDLGLMRGSSVQEPEHFSNEHIWLGCDNYFIIISAARLKTMGDEHHPSPRLEAVAAYARLHYATVPSNEDGVVS